MKNLLYLIVVLPFFLQGQQSNNLGWFLAVSSAQQSYVLDEISVVSRAAFSLRKLRLAYTGPAIRVRRTSDNTEQDINFTSQGDLNITQLLSFVGTGSGFVSIWYDQSGNSLNATQTNAASQPTIVSSGSIITINGRPSILSPTAQQFLNVSGGILGVNGSVLSENFVSLVGRAEGAIAHSFISNDSPGLFGHAVGIQTNGSYNTMFNRGFFTGSAASLPFSALATISTQWSTTQGNRGWVNGLGVWTGGNDTGNGGSSTTTLFVLQPNNRLNSAIYLSEVVVTQLFVTNDNRQKIEKNQGSYYAITVL